MEKVQGKGLEHAWYIRTTKQRMSVVEKIFDIERILFAIQFPASGSMYFKESIGAITTPFQWLSKLTRRINFVLDHQLNTFGGIESEMS